MKLDPGFINHWKTERLIDQLGAEGLIVVLRMWGQAQIRREWKGLELTPKRLALETKWKGDAEHLFSVLTDPDAPWLDKEDCGTYSLHGFEEHQRQVIHLWSAGGKGGRPKKKEKDVIDNNKDTSSYSSSYPICSTNENQMVICCPDLITEKDVLPKGWAKLSTAQKNNRKVLANTETMKRIGEWFGRREDTLWTISETVALIEAQPSDPEINGMESFYLAPETEPPTLHHRRSLIVLLNNWQSELDKAREYARKTKTKQ